MEEHNTLLEPTCKCYYRCMVCAGSKRPMSVAKAVAHEHTSEHVVRMREVERNGCDEVTEGLVFVHAGRSHRQTIQDAACGRQDRCRAIGDCGLRMSSSGPRTRCEREDYFVWGTVKYSSPGA